MTLESALAVIDIEGVKASQDGHNVMLTFKSSDGGRFNLVIPAGMTERLMTTLADGVSQAARLRENGPRHFGVFSVEWWEVTTLAETHSTIFSFRLPGGMVMAYSLDQKASFRLAETVLALLKDENNMHREGNLNKIIASSSPGDDFIC